MKAKLTVLAVTAALALPLVAVASLPETRLIETRRAETRLAQRPQTRSIGELQQANTVTVSGEVAQLQGDEFVLRDGFVA